MIRLSLEKAIIIIMLNMNAMGKRERETVSHTFNNFARRSRLAAGGFGSASNSAKRIRFCASVVL